MNLPPEGIIQPLSYNSNKTHRNKLYLVATGLFIGALLFQLLLQIAFKSLAIGGQYFQEWSSEALMQTVSIVDLRDDPLKSLWFTHIQPPMLDAIRAILAQLWRTAEAPQLISNVDRSLYLLWSVFYAAVGAVIFLWLAETTSDIFALIAAILFLLHPAHIFYATLLDTTILTALLILLSSFELWKLKSEPQRSILPISILVILLFITRSIFQLAFTFVYMIPLLLFKIPFKKILLFLTITVTFTGLVTLKQFMLFRLPTTSSFTGFNLLRSIGESPEYYFKQPISNLNVYQSLPEVLSDRQKADGSINFNNLRYLELNKTSINKYLLLIRVRPISQILKSYVKNFKIYFQPSSQYTPHVIVDRLPWRALYDRIFSNWIFLCLLLVSIITWLILTPREQYLAGIGMFIPIGAAMFISIITESGENMRFKYFVEPVLFVFISTQLYLFINTLIIPRLRRPIQIHA